MFAEIDVTDITVACAGDAGPGPFAEGRHGLEAVDDILFQEITQEADALPGFAAQFPALRPPDQIFRMRIGFAMAGIAAACDCDPEAMHQLFSRQVAPRLDDVAFIFGLVVDDRFAIGLAPFLRALHVPVLNAGMGDPRLAMIEVHRRLAVMDRLQMAVGVIFFENVEIAVPLLQRLGIEQEIILVGKRPPNIAIGGKARCEIGDVAEILFGGHVGIAPAVVGVEHDDVGFDAEIAECCDLALEMAEEDGVRTIEVLLAVDALFEAGIERLVDVVRIVLREDAHADLVEASLLQCLKRLRLHLEWLVCPGIAGRAERQERLAVGMGEMELVVDMHGAVVALGWLGGNERAGLAIQFRCLRACPE